MEHKLSELIRKGCKGTHQITGDYFSKEYDPEAGRTIVKGCCALGAIMVALGKTADYELMDMTRLVFEATGVNLDRAYDFDASYPLSDVISTMNDDAGLTREQIADHLESNGL